MINALRHILRLARLNSKLLVFKLLISMESGRRHATYTQYPRNIIIIFFPQFTYFWLWMNTSTVIIIIVSPRHLSTRPDKNVIIIISNMNFFFFFQSEHRSNFKSYKKYLNQFQIVLFCSLTAHFLPVKLFPCEKFAVYGEKIIIVLYLVTREN